MIELFLRAHAKGKKVLTDLKFGTFIGRFWSDGAASMAVKGLRVHRLRLTFSATTHVFNSDSTLLMIASGEQDIRTSNNGSILLRISAVILIAVSLKNDCESEN